MKALVDQEVPANRAVSFGDPVEREYNGHPVLTLNPQSRFPFSFGPAKAELILRSLEVIRAFARKHQGSSEPSKRPDS